MGGQGSGNHYHWWRSSKKAVVEDCLRLDAARWMREGILWADHHAFGSWRWDYASGQHFSVTYEVETRDTTSPHVRLRYSWIWTSTQQQESADYRVRLMTTRPQFGGLRWWFICPLVSNGRPCGRRVGKLYLPPALSLLRLPALPRIDVHQLPGEPQVRRPLSLHGPQHGPRLRHGQAACEPDRQEDVLKPIKRALKAG